jgi:predicted RNA-binding protein YlxR (DUF448 family)
VTLRSRMRTKKNTRKVTVAGKPLPRRTCVACRQIKPKRELMRVVRTPEGKIELDITGKKEGRGAYICPTGECMDKALKGNQLERTLKTSITAEDREKLVKDLKDISEGTE